MTVPANAQVVNPGSEPAGTSQQVSSDIIVTGSRVVTNGNQAPTPVTVVSTERLQETSPSSIPDALNRLPQFASQVSTRNIGNAQGNSTGNYLSLRSFGSNRNLILLDGNRLPPTASSGAVDTNTIPQALIERVEVVTGGASAVYGSDAVTGVVNFIINKNFEGAKFNGQYGISDYGDMDSWRVGAAVGTSLFDGRGHFVASFDHRDAKGLIGVGARPGGDDLYVQGGNGTESNPYRLVRDGRVLAGTRGGFISGGYRPDGTLINTNDLPAGLRDITFEADGIPSQFIHGAPTGVSGTESGGSGGYYSASTLLAPVRTNQAFARFSYDLSSNIGAYVQGSYADSYADYPYASARFNADILSGNPFLPASVQQAMTDNNIPSIRISRLPFEEDGIPGRTNHAVTKNIFAMAGLTGTIFGDFDWSVNYIHSVSKQKVKNRNNTEQIKFAAALDAVIDPDTNQVVCQASLTQYANRFSGCEPLNIFGPTAHSQSAYNWILFDTGFVLTNRMDDVNFAISGSPFELWAGPVRFAVSGEYRWLSLDNDSNVESIVPPDCTGLRLNCSASTPAYQHDASNSMFAKQNVKEIAGELLIPLAADLPLIRSFELNLAARYTDYSTSGHVTTLKAGASWEVLEGVRIRASRSRDIRAPTLQDLFRPVSGRFTGYTDLLTNSSGVVQIREQGNGNLVPEVANTTTLGIVLQPVFLPNFSLAVDWYDIRIDNAIVGASATSLAIQRECIDSGGTSPFCALFDRPLPFSNTTPSNFPTLIYSQNLNAAKQWTNGVDFEANYRVDLSDVSDGLPGVLGIRALVGYQPTLKRQTVSSSPPTQSAGVAGMSKVNANIGVDYSAGGLRIAITERWQSSQHPSDPDRNVDLRPKIPAYSYTDIAVNYQMELGPLSVTPFFTIENLFNKKPPIIGTIPSVPGLFFPAAPGFDIVGRYFTGGVRASF